MDVKNIKRQQLRYWPWCWMSTSKDSPQLSQEQSPNLLDSYCSVTPLYHDWNSSLPPVSKVIFSAAASNISTLWREGWDSCLPCAPEPKVSKHQGNVGDRPWSTLPQLFAVFGLLHHLTLLLHILPLQLFFQMCLCSSDEPYWCPTW